MKTKHFKKLTGAVAWMLLALYMASMLFACGTTDGEGTLSLESIPTSSESDGLPTESEGTENVTGLPTEKETDAPTEVATLEQATDPAPTESPATSAPTEVKTDAPTEAKTDALTEIKTDAPTETPTEIPTDAPTEGPTESASSQPTDSATSAPTESGTAAPAPSEPAPLVGLSFSATERVLTSKVLSAFPQTVFVRFKLSSEDKGDGVGGVLFSNTIRWGGHLSYEINAKGQPCINIGRIDEREDGYRSYGNKTYTFDKIDVCTGKTVELYFVIDRTSAKIHCYMNGKLAQSVTAKAQYLSDDCYSKNPFVVGGSTMGSNYNYFRGELYDIVAWSDVRASKEIAVSYEDVFQAEDDALLFRYQFTSENEENTFGDVSGNGFDLYVDRLWSGQDVSSDFESDYSFAVVGDTQSLVNFYPEKMGTLYDWIVQNKEAQNIQCVLGLGDITENGTKSEFDLAKQNISKLDGVLPYLLSMGNHDKYDFKTQGYIPENRQDFLFNQTFCNEQYLACLDGYYGEGDVTCAYNTLELGNTKWLFVTLDFGPTDEMLEWASGVIAAHPDHKTVVITHAYLYRDGTTIDSEDCYASSRYNNAFNDGDEIFDKLIKKHKNIVLAIGGHDPHDHVVCTQVKGENGNTVTQLLVDPQYMDAFYGATGMVALLHFSEKDNSLTVRYYSTVLGEYGSEKSQFTVSLD